MSQWPCASQQAMRRFQDVGEQPKIWGRTKFFRLQASNTVFCLGHHLSKHKMTRYVKMFLGEWPFDPPGYAYGTGDLSQAAFVCSFRCRPRFSGFVSSPFLSALLPLQTRRHYESALVRKTLLHSGRRITSVDFPAVRYDHLLPWLAVLGTNRLEKKRCACFDRDNL